MSLATVFVAVAGYLVIWVSDKALGADGKEAFMVYWGLFFALAGIIDGLMQETTRAVAAHRETVGAGHGAGTGSAAGAAPVADGGHGAHAVHTPAAGAHAAHTPTLTGAARPLLVAAGVAAALGALVAVTSPLWVGTLLPDHHALGVALLTLGVASYTFQTTVCGLLSAAGRWSPFAVLITVDSGVRLVLALLAWAAGWHLVAFLVVTVAGAATWLAVAAVSPSARSALHGVADVPTRDFLRRAGTAMLASGANSVIITGFPVLIKATTSLPDGTLAAVIFAVTLTRAPILVPLQRFQPVLIVRFATARGRVLRAAAAPMAAIVGVAVVGAVAAFLLGPWILRLFFTPEVWSPGWVLAWLTLAAASTALLMVTGSAALAAERHGLYLGGWVLATVVAVLLFRLDLSPELRAVLGLGLGPLAGVVLHLVLLRVTGDPAAGSGAAATVPGPGVEPVPGTVPGPGAGSGSGDDATLPAAATPPRHAASPSTGRHAAEPSSGRHAAADPDGGGPAGGPSRHAVPPGTPGRGRPTAEGDVVPSPQHPTDP